jgi:prevent-host-death family protein
VAKSVSVSEARKRLPGIIDAVSKDGGRVDITRRGVPVASIVRTRDIAQQEREPLRAASLAVEFNFDPADLVDVVRGLRSRVGKPRQAPKPAQARRSNR